MAESLNRTHARQVKQRLEQFAKSRGGSWSKFMEDLGVRHTTASNWRNPKSSALPGIPKLVKLAERWHLSLDWLILGEGSELRGSSRPDAVLADDLRDRVLSDLGVPDDARGEGARAVIPDGEDMVRELVELNRRRLEKHQAAFMAKMPIAIVERLEAATDERRVRMLTSMLVAAVKNEHKKAVEAAGQQQE